MSRWLTSAFLVPLIIFCLTLFLLPAAGRPASIAGMGNIAYALFGFFAIIIFNLIYGLIFPIVAPRWAISFPKSLVVATLVAGLLLFWMRGFLENEIGARMWWASLVNMTVSFIGVYLFGFLENPFLAKLRLPKNPSDSPASPN